MNQFNNHPLYRKHNLDSAMSSLWAFYKNRFFMLFIISLVMSLIIQYASTMVDFKELQSITDPMVMLEEIRGYITPIFIIFLISLLFSVVLQHYIIYNPVDSHTTILESATRSLKYFIPYLIIMILLAFAGSVAIILGLFVLIVGVFFSFLYVLTLYFFILPVLMVEGSNIGNAIARTFKLAHRNFWSNLGWVAVFIIIIIVISVILSGIILLPFTGSFLKTIINPENTTNAFDFATNPVFIMLSAIVNALTMPLAPIFACILYFNGKAGEEQIEKMSVLKEEDEKVRVEDLYARPYSDDHPENPELKS